MAAAARALGFAAALILNLALVCLAPLLLAPGWTAQALADLLFGEEDSPLAAVEGARVTADGLRVTHLALRLPAAGGNRNGGPLEALNVLRDLNLPPVRVDTLAVNGYPPLRDVLFDADRRGGSLELAAALEFSREAPLSRLLPALPVEGDVIAGEAALRLALTWIYELGGGVRAEGPLALELEGLAGYAGEYYFVGLDTGVEARYDSRGGLASRDWAPASLDLLGAGLPLSELKWQYRFDTAERAFSIRAFEARVLDGRMLVERFDYRHGQESLLPLQVAGLRLGAVSELLGYPGVELEGTVNGRLPLRLSGTSVTIEDGLLQGQPPGGAIRYRPPDPPEDPGAGTALVYQALSDYRYDSLEAAVHYGADGELLLEVALQGVNPQMNGGQRINLNVNVHDHIPTLLKSLRAGRRIRDALERRLERNVEGGA